MNTSTEGNNFDQFRERFRAHPWSSLILTLIVVALNIWLDYYHYPLFGTLFDIFLLVAFFRSYLNSRYRAGQQAKSR